MFLTYLLSCLLSKLFIVKLAYFLRNDSIITDLKIKSCRMLKSALPQHVQTRSTIGVSPSFSPYLPSDGERKLYDDVTDKNKRVRHSYNFSKAA